MKTTRTCAAVTSLLLALGACPGRPHHTTPLDAGLDASASEDAAFPEPDAGAPPLRTLGTRPFFGTMPVGNRVFDPRFSMIDGISWFAYGGDTFRSTQVMRAQLIETPDMQPVLRVISTTGDPKIVTGAVVGGAGPMIASVWLGRGPDSASFDPENLTVGIIGLVPEDTAAVLGLSLDPESQLVLGDVTWLRYEARLEHAPEAWALLSVEDATAQDLYVSAPLLLREEEGAGLARAASFAVPAAVPRALSALERRAVERVTARLRERLGTPPGALARRPPHLLSKVPSWMER